MLNDEDASRPSVEQQSAEIAIIHVAHVGMNTDRYVPQPQEDIELMIFEVHMEKA